MYVENGLSGGLVAVHHRAIPFFRETFLSGNVFSSSIKAANQRVIFFANVIDRRNVFTGDDKHMGRCLRVDVPERDRRVGFVNYVCRDVAPNYLAEQAVFVSQESLLLIYGPASEKRVRERTTVHVFELSAERNAVRNATGLH